MIDFSQGIAPGVEKKQQAAHRYRRDGSPPANQQASTASPEQEVGKPDDPKRRVAGEQGGQAQGGVEECLRGVLQPPAHREIREEKEAGEEDSKEGDALAVASVFVENPVINFFHRLPSRGSRLSSAWP